MGYFPAHPREMRTTSGRIFLRMAITLGISGLLLECFGSQPNPDKAHKVVLQRLLSVPNNERRAILDRLAYPPLWDDILEDANFPQDVLAVAGNTDDIEIKLSLLFLLQGVGTSDSEAVMIRIAKNLLSDPTLSDRQLEMLQYYTNTGGIPTAEFWAGVSTNIFRETTAGRRSKTLRDIAIVSYVGVNRLQAQCIATMCNQIPLESRLSQKMVLWRIASILTSKVPTGLRDKGGSPPDDKETGRIHVNQFLLRLFRNRYDSAGGALVMETSNPSGPNIESKAGGEEPFPGPWPMYQLSPSEFSEFTQMFERWTRMPKNVSAHTGNDIHSEQSPTNSPPSPPNP